MPLSVHLPDADDLLLLLLLLLLSPGNNAGQSSQRGALPDCTRRAQYAVANARDRAYRGLACPQLANRYKAKSR